VSDTQWDTCCTCTCHGQTHTDTHSDKHTHVHILRHTHTCTHAYTYTADTHAHTHACTHTRTTTHTHTHTHTHMHTHARACVHILCRHARTHTRTHTRTHMHTHTRAHAYTYFADTHAHIHTHTHMHTHNHTHTRTHMHTHTLQTRTHTQHTRTHTHNHTHTHTHTHTYTHMHIRTHTGDITRLHPASAVISDGSELSVDLLVHATGNAHFQQYPFFDAAVQQQLHRTDCGGGASGVDSCDGGDSPASALALDGVSGVARGGESVVRSAGCSENAEGLWLFRHILPTNVANVAFVGCEVRKCAQAMLMMCAMLIVNCSSYEHLASQCDQPGVRGL